LNKVVNAGQDFKFNPAPELVDLKGWMEEDEYNSAILTVNDKVKSARATSLDAVLLAGGAGMLPLIPWGVRYAGLHCHNKTCVFGIPTNYFRIAVENDFLFV
jgi:hypothetical protein